ncbi:FAD-binding oxidoreductase [Natronosporangium hydrolyticum]|uniref:FAD-binding oxidoreductase n=1 Tax=Natronosporangium hydrolyticum TaxID=2811111 RepID=A0A895YHJ2_9ACTN|nr:FAD-binding oxidoreductase [Natronosporangium hydrolyticum]QSB13188.1 FAD-binding oxidoreductase [Natronosporangium hydrolyticum]
MEISTTAVTALAQRMRGDVVLPDAPEFPRLRKPFACGLGEVTPQAVVRCAGVADVAEAVAFARAQRLPFALRSGGHSFADLSTSDGLVIDLAGLRSIEVGPETVTVGPGVRLGELADRLAEVGRVVAVGWNPTVAVGGAVLGGGYGMLGRYFGLGCDQLLAAQVVLADGRQVTVDEHREPELFWALRGAGWAGFGAVTSLTLRTHPAPRVSTFVHCWPWEQAAAVIDAWQHWAPVAPEEVNGELVLQSATPTGSGPRLVLFGAVVGGANDARPLVEEFLAEVDLSAELGELAELSPVVAARRHTYAGMPVSTVAQPGPPAGQRPWLRAVKSDFFDAPMPAEVIDALLAAFDPEPPAGQYREVELVPWGGAYARVAPAETAFVHRRAQFLIGHHGTALPHLDDVARKAATDWVQQSWRAVRPAASGAVYPNYPDAELPEWASAYFGVNLPRLRQVKARYDPAEVFRFGQSLAPA